MSGLMGLAGLMLVYKGISVSWSSGQANSAYKIKVRACKYRRLIFTTSLAEIVTLATKSVAIKELILDPTYWAIPAELGLSVALVITVPIRGYKLFLTTESERGWVILGTTLGTGHGLILVRTSRLLAILGVTGAGEK